MDPFKVLTGNQSPHVQILRRLHLFNVNQERHDTISQGKVIMKKLQMRGSCPQNYVKCIPLNENEEMYAQNNKV